MENITEIINICRSANRTVNEMMSRENITLDEWIESEKTKLDKNKTLPVLADKSDLIDLCAEYVAKRISKEAAEKVSQVLEYGVMFTPNHHGGLYSAQSFQGDLFYARFLKKINPNVPCAPEFSFGLVPLNSSTFARGLLAHTRTDDVEKIPIFPKAPTNAAASLKESFNAAMIRRTGDKAFAQVKSYRVRKKIRELMETLYNSQDILAQKRYAEQIFLIADGIYRKLSDITGIETFYHMEAEKIFSELLIKEYSKKDSFIYHFLNAPECIKVLNNTQNNEGRKFSSLLFLGCGDDERCFTLNLCEDGFLRGRNAAGKEYCFVLDFDTLSGALQEMKIMPHVYLIWLMGGFLRGFTWYGGIFQSQYLQLWHKKTCEILAESRMKDLKDSRENYDCSGYLSGPIYILFDTGDGAVNAGPLEVMAFTPSVESSENLFCSTDLKSAHEMGMFEFYNE